MMNAGIIEGQGNIKIEIKKQTTINYSKSYNV